MATKRKPVKRKKSLLERRSQWLMQNQVGALWVTCGMYTLQELEGTFSSRILIPITAAQEQRLCDLGVR